LAVPSAADVVDVSEQWKAHASSAPAARPSVNESSSTAAAPEKPSATPSCGCELLTTPEKLAKSTYAFTGRVWDVGTTKNGKRTIVFDVDEIFKGSPKPEMEVTEELSGTDCDLAFEVGKAYLVFAKWVWGSVVTSTCMGTKVIERAKRDAAGLGPSEEAKEQLYIRLRNACMGRIDTPCCLSSLKAMGSGYYVPEPEDGCPSGMVPDRLVCGGSYTWCIPFNDKGHRQLH